jgi:RNA polymerase sigma-70 factor (ECF subfamily)
MIKITRIAGAGDVTQLRVDGRILSKTTEPLERACRAALAARAPFVLDLSGVSFVDGDGAALLATLVDDGATVVGASPFVSELLRAVGRRDGSAEGRPADDADAPLLARLRQGDDDAFAELTRRYGGRMLAVARRMLRNEDDARDAVQEAFVAAFKSLDGFAGESKMSTWLHRIVVNAALMRLRTKRRKPEQAIEDLLPNFDETGHWAVDVPPVEIPADALERGEVRAIVRRCIDRLPESHRAVLLLRDIEELDSEETAAVLGLTTSAVKSRLHRARQALHTLLAHERLGMASAEPTATACDRARRAASHDRV